MLTFFRKLTSPFRMVLDRYDAFVLRHEAQLHGILYVFVYSIFVIPWMYFDEKARDYSFLPRRILFVLAALTGGLLFLGKRFNWKTIAVIVFLSGLGLLHWYLKEEIEPHYFFEWAYLELAILVLMAPESVKKAALKYSVYVFYFFIIKAFYFRIGAHIHGGLYSSNLYGTYLLYLSFIEVASRRYWNLIPALIVIFYVGSKACYFGVPVLLLYVLYLFLKDRQIFSDKRFDFIKQNTIRFSFMVAIAISVVVVFTFTKIMVKSDLYLNWEKTMVGSKKETTENNLAIYGMDKTPLGEIKKEVFLKERELQLEAIPLALEKPQVTDVTMSLGVRLLQYNYMFTELFHDFLILGDTPSSQKEMLGHNPHSAVPDFISRLGLLYLLVVLFFYRKLFLSMNMLFFNLALFPILCFQPYGFTIGHSIVGLSLIYALTQQAEKEEKT